MPTPDDLAIRRPVKRDPEPAPEPAPAVGAPPEPEPAPALAALELATFKKRLAGVQAMSAPRGVSDERTWRMGRDAAVAHILGPQG